MTKDPAFLFYYQDFLVGTNHMTTEQVGMYILCLCHQANKGNIRRTHLERICNNNHEDIYVIGEKFVQDNEHLDCLFNIRLRNEQAKRKELADKRRKSLEDWRAKQKTGKTARQYNNSNESENENESERYPHVDSQDRPHMSEHVNTHKMDFKEPIIYLNKKTGKSFDPKAKANVQFVKARYNEGRTIEQFKEVIDRKCEQWLKDPKMTNYLRPSTLFNATNFENYLNELDLPEDAQSGANEGKPHQRVDLKSLEKLVEENLSRIATDDMVVGVMRKVPKNYWWVIEKYLKRRYVDCKGISHLESKVHDKQ